MKKRKGPRRTKPLTNSVPDVLLRLHVEAMKRMLRQRGTDISWIEEDYANHLSTQEWLFSALLSD